MLTNILKSLLQPQSQAPVYCRICLRPNKDLHPLDSCLNFGFDVDSEEKLSLQHLLKDVSGCETQISTFGGLCDKCLEGLIAAFLFKRRCVRADATIDQVVGLLEGVVQGSQTACPTTTVLVQISPLALSSSSNIVIRNYESHENSANNLKFVNEIYDHSLDTYEHSTALDSDSDNAFAPDDTSSALQCDLCGKYFIYPCYLKLHLKYHGERTHQCKKCPKSFKTVYDLNRHSKTHEAQKGQPAKLYICPYCNKNLRSQCGYKNHVSLHEDGKKMCKFCNESFKTMRALYVHRKVIHDLEKRTFICNHCGWSLGSRYSLIKHLETHNFNSQDFKLPLPCPQCGKIYASMGALSNHLKKHGQRRHLCVICNKLYFTNNQLNRHFKTVHFGVKAVSMVLRCDICGSVRASKSSLIAHLKTHDNSFGLSKEKYPKRKQLCPICGKLITGFGPAAFKVHMERHGEPSYPCEICNKKYKTKTALSTHFKQVHVPAEEKTPYICDICGVVRTSKASIMMHIRVHEPKGTFKCDVCNKVFEREIYLKNHKLTHLNIRPEQCGICGNRFINKKALLYHSRLHTGERPYACEVCGERFVSENRRNNHYKCKHTEKSVSCKICGAMFHTQSFVNSHVKKVHHKKKYQGEAKTLKVVSKRKICV